MQLSAHSIGIGRLCALAVLLFVTACSSTTGTSNNAASSAAAGNADTVAQTEDDPLICETVIPSGTRIGHKVCMRKSQKDRIRENSQTVTIENQRRSVIGSPTGN